MDRAARQQRLGVAIKNGQFWVVDRMLEADPDLPLGNIGLACCFYLRDEVERLMSADPKAAIRKAPLAPPLTILAQSHAIHHYPEREADMLAIAELLLSLGADVNAGLPVEEGSDHMLSTLYFAIGHANNMPLASWLLDHGADPNDGESLYHSTELGHHEGLRLLLSHGADPKGTNALLRAMDFHDIEAVKILMEAGAEVDEFNDAHVGGERPWVVPALHQAARRLAPVAMAELLLDAGASATREFEGVTPYSMARVYGNQGLARLLEARGAATNLSREEALLARAAEGADSPGEYIDPEKLPEAYRDLIRSILHLPSTTWWGIWPGWLRWACPLTSRTKRGSLRSRSRGGKACRTSWLICLAWGPTLAISTGMAARCSRRSCTGQRTTRTWTAATTLPAFVWRWSMAWRYRDGP
jgi:ankyrin repeat protein